MSEIHLYPSLIRELNCVPTQPIRTKTVDSGSLYDFLADALPAYAENPDFTPWEIELEGQRGEVVPPSDYAGVMLDSVLVVHIYANPQRRAIGSIFSAVVDLFSSVFSWLMPSIPTPNANGGIDQGSQINDPNTTINRPRLNGVINQIAGQVKLAPYYLAPPHTYFIDPRTKAVDILLCVTWGPCLLPSSQIRIGETPINALGTDVNWQAFMPGEDISTHRAHELWYTAPEVGAAGNGQAGLKLKSTVDITTELTASYIDVSDDTITVPADADIPTDWAQDLLLNISIQRQIVASSPTSPDVRAIYNGSFSDLGLSVGDSIVMTDSVLAGEYIVHSVSSTELTLSYPDLSPVTSPTGGTYLVSIDRLGARYRIVTTTADSIMVEKLLADGNLDTAWQGWTNARYHNNWRVRVDDIYSEGQWLGPFNAQKSGTLINRLQAIVLMPRGLGKAETDYVRWRKRSVELEWREIGAGEWVSVPYEMEEGTRDQLGFTIDVELPQPMAVECRLRRSEPELTDIQSTG